MIFPSFSTLDSKPLHRSNSLTKKTIRPNFAKLTNVRSMLSLLPFLLLVRAGPHLVAAPSAGVKAEAYQNFDLVLRQLLPVRVE